MHGDALAARAVAMLRPHAAQVIVSANRHRSRYMNLADGVVADRIPGFAGPLAGIEAGLCAIRSPLLIICPCDIGTLPRGLVARLIRTLRLHGSIDIAVVHDRDRRQPLLAAVRRRVAPQLRAYLASGGRSAYGWLETLRVRDVHTQIRLENHNVATPIPPAKPGNRD